MNAKKLISMVLALVMMLALASTAMAAGEGTITVENPKADATYTAYKIFDVVYNTDKTAYSYTIAANSPWLTTVNAQNGITLTQVSGKSYKIVTTSDNFSAAAFAAALKGATEAEGFTVTGTRLTVAEGATVATATSLDLGYYFVTSSTGALCNLTTTDPSANIRDKNDVPFDKVDDDQSVEVGQTVNYDITGKVPDTTGFTTYTYKITDTMSDGLTFNKDVKVTIGGTDVTTACTITYNTDGDGFELTIPVMNYQTQVGAEIKVEYTATVNENAIAQVENNTAKLTYSNDPTDSTKTTSTPDDKETVYSAKIVINKYKQGAEGTKLSGAKFVLKKVTGEEGAQITSYYKYTEAKAAEGETPAVEAKTEWVSNQDDATEVTTDENGAAEFKGLEDGTYYLVETEAPAGYNKLTSDVTVTINGASATVDNVAVLTTNADVANNTGAELPETGGMGTTVLYIAGGLLVAAAVIMMINKRRAGAAE